MSVGGGTSKSSNAPVIDPAAFDTQQREGLFTQLGSLLGFDYKPGVTTPTAAPGGGILPTAASGFGRNTIGLGGGGNINPFRGRSNGAVGNFLQNRFQPTTPTAAPGGGILPTAASGFGRNTKGLGGGGNINPFRGRSNRFQPTTTYTQGSITGRDITRPQVAGFDINTANSAFRDPFQSALLNPYQPTSAEEQLLSQVSDRASAGFANRGLGFSPVAATDTAASIAPTLVGLRQQQIGNLAQALGMDIGEQRDIYGQRLQQRGMDIGQRGQDIGERQGQIDSILKLLESAGYRRNLGQEGKSSSFNFNVAAPGAAPGVGGASGATK